MKIRKLINILRNLIVGLILTFLSFAESYSSDWKVLYDSTMYYYNQEQFKNALEWGEKCKVKAVEQYGKESEQYEKTIYKLVDLYFYCDKAMDAYNTAIEDSAVTLAVYGDCSQNYLGALNNLGLIYYFFNQFGNSVNILNVAKTCLEGTPNSSDSTYAFTLNNLALVYEKTGQYKLAEPLYLKSIEIIKRTKGENDFTYSETVHNLAALYKGMGKYKQADTLYQKSLEIIVEIYGEKHAKFAIELNNLGELYKLMGRYDEAEPKYKSAVNLRKDLYGADHPEYAKSLSNLAHLYFLMGRYDKAEKLFKEAAEIQKVKRGADHPEYAATLNNLALLYDKIKEYESAEPLYKTVLVIFKIKFTEKHPFYATTLDNLAKLYKKMGRFDESEKMFLQSKLIREETIGSEHPNFAKTLYNLGELYELLQKFTFAEPNYKKALKLRKEKLGDEHPDYAKSLAGLARLYKQWHKYQEAEPYYIEALSKYLDQVKRYFPYLSEKEKLQFWSSVRNSFEDFDSFCSKYYDMKPEIVTNMYDNLLVTKGLILSSTKKVLRKIRQSNDDKVVALLDNWQSTKDYWLWLVQNPEKAKEQAVNVDSVAEKANELEKELSSKSEDFKKAFETKKITWKDVQNTLSDGEAAIEIIRFRANLQKASNDTPDTIIYAALVIRKDTKDHPDLVLLKNGDELENQYIKLYGNLVKIQKIRPFAETTNLEMELMSEDIELLYTQFWKRITAKLDGIQRVFLSVDGVYNSINLMTLINPESKKYLLEETDLRIVTNTKDLIEYAENKNQSIVKDAVLFGDPTYNLNPDEYKIIPPLPGTKVEVEKISKDMKSVSWKVSSFLDERALEETIKAVDNPGILHIATHGAFMPDIKSDGEDIQGADNPLLRSMLYFAGAENENEGNTTDDGKLTAYEAMDLNLDNTNLVVLSACETGLGEVKNGEGVYGLQRAFQVAGARSLIMSLWTVSDEATQQLMNGFYDKILAGVGKREAFRQAQMELKAKFPEFYFWGAFVMVGE